MSGLSDSLSIFCANLPLGPNDGWEQSPCKACAKAPCCRHVPLCETDPDTRRDFDGLLFLLQFREIELGLKDDGTWIVLYRSTCRFLDTATNQCPVHETADQPEICKRYSGKTCWYRKVFFSHQNQLFLRFDFERLSAWLGACRFDAAGVLEQAPSWPESETLLCTLPFHDFDSDQIRNSRLVDASSGKTIHPGRTVRLCVPPGPPVQLTGWDFVRFRLGFPGLSFHLLGRHGWFEAEAHSREPQPAGFTALGEERLAGIEAAGQNWLGPERLLRPQEDNQADLLLGERRVVNQGKSPPLAAVRTIHCDELPAVIAACQTDASGRITAYPDRW